MNSTITARQKSSRAVGDAFAVGVMVMLLLNLAQRGVGLLRGLGFCHFLSDIELGQFALANSFFIIAVPIAVLGLPGSFGRFVETFRCRGQLGRYFRNVTIASGCGLSIASLLILWLPDAFGWLLFRGAVPYSMVVWCVITLISATIFSFVNELVSALREVRVVSLMQFIQSLVFAACGLCFLSFHPSWIVLLPSYTIACGLALLPGLFVLLTQYRAEFRVGCKSYDVSLYGFWMRILPYAAALWVMNLLGNLFEVSDRYMLLHLIREGEEAGQAMVGQYHCGRILPNLLTSIAIMLGGVLLPFMSADWEAGRHAQIAARLRQVMQSLSIGFMLLSIAAMCTAPLLFDYGFGGRYQQAQAILPISLLQATWASLFIVAQSYMLCAERGTRLALLMVAGLSLNFGLNWWLIQTFGLPGAVAATATANLVTLFMLIREIQRGGCHLGYGTAVLCCVPVVIAAGPTATACVLTLIIFIAGRSDWLLTAEDRQQIDANVLPKLHKLGLRLDTLWP